MAAPSATVRYSSGPDKDPFGMYATTNSILHDLKTNFSSAPARKPEQGMGGFARNNLPTKAKEAPGVPNPKGLGRTYNRLIDDPAAEVGRESVSAASFAMHSTTLGERAIAERDFGTIGGDGHDGASAAEIADAVARRRAKNGSGFTTNHKPGSRPLEIDDTPAPGQFTALAKASRGRTEPLVRENDFQGPMAMSTTSKASFTAPPDVDPELMNPNATIDMDQARVGNHGSSKNLAPTLFFQPHDGWMPTTENREKFQRPNLGAGDEPITGASLRGSHRDPTANRKPDASSFAHAQSPEEEATLRLTYLQDQKLKRADPILHDVLTRNDPWATTNRAMMGPKTDPTKTALEDVLAENGTARDILNAGLDDRDLMLSALGGAPHKGAASGFAANTSQPPMRTANGSRALSPRSDGKYEGTLDGLEWMPTMSRHQAQTARHTHSAPGTGGVGVATGAGDPDQFHTTYKSDFYNQMKNPERKGQFYGLSKATSGFDRGNRDNLLGGGHNDAARYMRKV